MFTAHLLAVPAIVSSISACQPAETFVTLATVEQLPVLQAELGITAVSAVLADLSTAEIAAIRATTLQQTSAPALMAARAAAAELERQIAAIKEVGDAMSPAQRAELQQLQAGLTTTQAQVSAARAQLAAAVRASVPTANWAEFDRINAAPSAIPSAMRVLDWSASDLTALAAALADERKAQGDLSLLTQAERERLLAARTNSAVVVAAQRLSVRLVEVSRALRGLTN